MDRINPLGKFLDFMSMARVILDTYPFGGCNTSMEAFYINKVVKDYGKNDRCIISTKI